MLDAIFLTLLAIVGVWMLILMPFDVTTYVRPSWVGVVLLIVLFILGLSLETWVIKGAVDG